MLRLPSVPIAVTLFLTNKCNLMCAHCFATALEAEPFGSELTREEWVRVIRRLSELRVFNIAFSGGEVFVRPDALDILAAAADCRFSNITVVTNATVIDRVIARRLRDLGYLHVGVSIDGTEETHDQIRGRRGAFREALSGLHLLVQNGIAPVVMFVAMKKNLHEVSSLSEMVYSLGVRAMSIVNVLPQGRALPEYFRIRLTREEREELRETVSRIRATHPDLNMPQDGSLYYDRLPQEISSGGKPNAVFGCGAASKECVITPTGWVAPCPVLVDFKGGNIRTDDIGNIWRNAPAFCQIRELGKMSMEQVPFCKDCRYNVMCNAGCRGKSHYVYGSLLMPDPDCPFWRKEKE